MTTTLFYNGNIYIDSSHKVNNILVENTLVKAHNVNIEDIKNIENIENTENAKSTKSNIKMYDLKGKTIYPGFNDSHTHVMEAGYILSVGINLNGKKNVDEICDEIKSAIKQDYDEEVAIGLGFELEDYDKWSLEDLKKLDEATGDLPFMSFDHLGHNVILNTAGMKMLNITKDFETPFGGKIIKENENLTGMFRESAISYPGSQFLKKFSTQSVKKGAKLAIDYWAKLGYTAIVDLMGVPGFAIMMPEVFYELEKEGELNLRVNYCYTFSDASELDEMVKYCAKDTDLVRFYGGKIFIDGAFAGGEAWTSWPHKNNISNENDCNNDNERNKKDENCKICESCDKNKNKDNNKEDGYYGLQLATLDDSQGESKNIFRIIEKAESLGINMHYHVQGDMAVETVIKALAQVKQRYGFIKCTHTLAHAGFVTDEQVQKIQSLNEESSNEVPNEAYNKNCNKKYQSNIVLTMQPKFWDIEENAEYYYGAKRMKESYQIAKHMNAGLSVGISTDFNVSPAEDAAPMSILQTVINGGRKHEHDAITAKQFLRGVTEYSGYVSGKNDVGTLMPGKKADMTIFDKDFLQMTKEEISKNPPKIVETVISGRITDITSIDTHEFKGRSRKIKSPRKSC